MKRIVGLFVSTFLMCGSGLMAQSEIDAYKLSQTDINGTARYLGMSGAFGALGGDVSVINSNPAGLGIFRSSEIVGSVSLNMYNTSNNWNGIKSDENKTRFNLDNFSYVGYFPTGNDEGVVGWNVGFSYNRIKNFNRTYRMRGSQPFSLADYIAEVSYGYSPDQLGSDNAYRNLPWMPVLGYQGWFTDPLEDNEYHSVFSTQNKDGSWNYYEPIETNVLVHEKGGIDQYNFAFAMNISDIVFLGATFGVTDMNYRLQSYYTEDFGYDVGDLYLQNGLSTDGTGYTFNIGTIVRPTDFLRLGVAYNSPTWYKLTDYYYATTEINNYLYENPKDQHYVTETPNYNASDYRFRTPDKWIFSAAGILGRNALISVDYELVNYGNSRFHDVDGYAFYDDPLLDPNTYIKRNYKNTHTIKVGAEYKVTPQFAIRAGGAWQTSSTESFIQNGQEEVYVAGTVPHFTVDRGMMSYSVGLGYRFTPSIYMDLAYVYRQHKEYSYAFSNAYYGSGDERELMVPSQASDLKTNTNRVALTLGYKF